MERTLRAARETGAAFERVRDLLLHEPEVVLAEPGAARPTARSFVVSVEAEWPGGAAGATHAVLLELGLPTLEERSAQWPLRWRPTIHRRLLPPFEGTLRVEAGADGTVVRLDGAYEPPLGPIGAFGDGVLGHRLARSTIDGLLDGIAERIERRLRLRTPVSVPPAPYPPDLRDLV
jgi:hypothetical protein